MTSASRKFRVYRLSAEYRQYHGDHEIQVLDAWHRSVPAFLSTASTKQ